MAGNVTEKLLPKLFLCKTEENMGFPVLLEKIY
jgi:hypothetical protein